MTNPSSQKSQQTIFLTNQEVIDNFFFVYSLTKQVPEFIRFDEKLNFDEFKNLILSLIEYKFITVSSNVSFSLPKTLSIAAVKNHVNTPSDIGYLTYVEHWACPKLYLKASLGDDVFIYQRVNPNNKSETTNLIDLWYSLGNAKK